eukprot:CAMPEP_0170931464 /NCGR_PEP_ID=MMETSP0735-20130129/16183_1 /TAXON_ID=186038 /ORGANISM="Fragilariopsis kerguelensis, Strain L26-C5" /LENGTH=59 /DNA_ID=CAMNT_0011333317 /DNA_START=41 /DNA_END=217 /DNA_ORIENTATION=+
MSTKKESNDDEDDPLMVTASTSPDNNSSGKLEGEKEYQESYAQATTEVEVDGLPNQEVS